MFGDALREAVGGGRAWISSVTKTAAAGTPLDIPLAHKDAVFLSPHKFIGGPGTPGVLIVKRALLSNTVPAMPGGGSIR